MRHSEISFPWPSTRWIASPPSGRRPRPRSAFT
jgi:hypothetical protein